MLEFRVPLSGDLQAGPWRAGRTGHGETGVKETRAATRYCGLKCQTHHKA